MYGVIAAARAWVLMAWDLGPERSKGTRFGPRKMKAVSIVFLYVASGYAQVRGFGGSF